MPLNMPICTLNSYFTWYLDYCNHRGFSVLVQVISVITWYRWCFVLQSMHYAVEGETPAAAWVCCKESCGFSERASKIDATEWLGDGIHWTWKIQFHLATRTGRSARFRSIQCHSTHCNNNSPVKVHAGHRQQHAYLLTGRVTVWHAAEEWRWRQTETVFFAPYNLFSILVCPGSSLPDKYSILSNVLAEVKSFRTSFVFCIYKGLSQWPQMTKRLVQVEWCFGPLVFER